MATKSKTPRKKKAQTSPAKYNRASADLGAYTVRPAFSPRLAMSEYHSWVYSCAKKNAEARAAIPLRLYVRSTSGTRSLILQGTEIKSVTRQKKSYLFGDRRLNPCASVMQKAVEFRDGFVEVTFEHPILKVLRDVNPYIDGYNFSFLRHLYLEMSGNAFIHPIMGASGPVELYSLFPPWMEIIPGKNPGDPLVMGYLYGQGEKMQFSTDEILHWKVSDPKDPRGLYGAGNVQAAWAYIKTADAAQDYQYHMYSNIGRADMAFLFEQDVTEEELDRQHQHLSQQLRKKGRAERHLTMSGVKEIKPLNFEPTKLEIKNEIVEGIAACFGIPPQILLGNDSILSNLENGIKLWREQGLQPGLIRDEETLNSQLLPLFGEDIANNSFLAYDPPVDPEDDLRQTQKMIQLVSAGIMTRDEARESIGLEPLGEGEETNDIQSTERE